MKVWYFILYMLYLLFGCFTLAFVMYSSGTPVWVIYLTGGIWGYIVGTDANKRF